MNFLDSANNLGNQVEISFILDFDKKAEQDVLRHSVSVFLGYPIVSGYAPLGPRNISSNFQLEKRRDRAGDAWRISTPFMGWYEARNIFSKITKWIREHAETNDSCDLTICIKFSKHSSFQLSKANLLKFILDIKEDKIFDAFPLKKNSPYSKPVRKSLFVQMSKSGTAVIPWNNLDLTKSNDSLYAVEFGGPFHNFLLLRYFGGAGYEFKKTFILDTLDEILNAFLESMNDPILSYENKEELKKIEEKFNTFRKSFKSISEFKEAFPDVKFTVDLSSNESYVNPFFVQLRGKLIEILAESDMKEGKINYDSDKGKFQIKDAKLNESSVLEGLDILDSEIEGLVKECDLFGCTIKGSNLNRCNLFNQTVAENSYLFDCYVNNSSEIKNCHFSGFRGVMNGEMTGGLFESGKVNKKGKISDTTKVIQIEKI